MLHPNQSATSSIYPSQPVSSSTYDPDVFADEEELFTIRTANTWLQEANKRPVPRMLFGKLWYEGDYASCLPIVTWANPYWQCKLPM
jgi:hypothetical protein